MLPRFKPNFWKDIQCVCRYSDGCESSQHFWQEIKGHRTMIHILFYRKAKICTVCFHTLLSSMVMQQRWQSDQACNLFSLPAVYEELCKLILVIWLLYIILSHAYSTICSLANTHFYTITYLRYSYTSKYAYKPFTQRLSIFTFEYYSVIYEYLNSYIYTCSL